MEVVQIEKIAVGKHIITARLMGITKDPEIKEEKSFSAFDWKFAFGVEYFALLWKGKETEFTMNLISELESRPIKPGTEILLGKARITLSMPTVEVRTKPEKCAEFALSRDLSGSGKFTTNGALGIKAVSRWTVTQPDSKVETYTIGPAFALWGMPDVKAFFSFKFKPVRALIGMTRQYQISQIALKVNEGPEGCDP